MFFLNLICCIGGSIILAGAMNGFINWWYKRPVKEEKQPPFYITRTYAEIKKTEGIIL